MLFLPLLLAAVPALAYKIVPGLANPQQPACTAVTFYYNDAADLASATSTFMSSSSLCAAPSAAPSLCVFSTGSGQLSNPDFECIGANALDPWVAFTGVVEPGTVRIVAGTVANPAESGNYMLEFQPITPAGQTFLYQQISDSAGSTATFTFYAKLDPVFNDLTGCDFSAGALLGNGGQPFEYFLGQGGIQPPTTSWQQYSFTFTATGMDKIYVQWRFCSAGAIIYVDNFALAESV